MWIKYFTITPIVEDLVCTGEGEKCISSALKTKGKMWHRPPCQELTVHAQAPSVDCTERRAPSSDFSELPGIRISGPQFKTAISRRWKWFFVVFWNVRTQYQVILKSKLSWMCKDWWQCYHYIFEIYSMARKDFQRDVLGSRFLLARHHICPPKKISRIFLAFNSRGPKKIRPQWEFQWENDQKK